MSGSSTAQDPRGIITPEAFHVSPDLLGLPLAPPGKRLAAVLVDLVVIGIITLITRSFALVLGIVIAASLLRASMRRTPVRHNVFDRARRFSIGCLGLGVGLVTIMVWVGLAIERSDLASELEDLDGDLSGLVIDIDDDGGVEVRRAPTEPDAGDVVETRDLAAVRDGVSLYSTAEALEAYAALLRSGSDTEADRELRGALEARLSDEIAADTLSALQERLSELERDARVAEARRVAAEAELEQAENSGLWGSLMGMLDDLGFGFGWAALYTTILLTATGGQTLGKRLLGIRVVRLDGERINWWVAFERAGGYAAGFATGLLGFAQVYWDSNRQAIHDRIVGTVVVLDGAERVHDWEAAL